MGYNLKTAEELLNEGLIPGDGTHFVNREWGAGNPHLECWELVNPGSQRPLYEDMFHGKIFYKEFYTLSKTIQRPLAVFEEQDKKRKILKLSGFKRLRIGSGMNDDAFIDIDRAKPERITQVFRDLYRHLHSK